MNRLGRFDRESSPLLQGSSVVDARTRRTAAWRAALCISGLLGLVLWCAVILNKPWHDVVLAQLRYYYVPATSLRYDPATKHQVLAQEVASITPLQMRILEGSQSLYELAPNQTTAPPGAIRSCAISSLVLQSTLVFNGWDRCGYMLLEGEKMKLEGGDNKTDLTHTVISAPPNNTDCTPAMMKTDRCATKFVRTVLRNNPISLQTCLAKVQGVSQTCTVFNRCGPRVYDSTKTQSAGASSSGPTDVGVSVCNSPSASYYKEEAILRMCGICDMFNAIMPANFKSPSAKFAFSPFAEGGEGLPQEKKDGGGGGGGGGSAVEYVLLTLLILLVCVAFFLCFLQLASTEATGSQRLV